MRCSSGEQHADVVDALRHLVEAEQLLHAQREAPGCSTGRRGSPCARRAGSPAATSSARRSSRCRCADSRCAAGRRLMVSPSSSSTRRSTPCVLGCCGPMLTVIVSVRISGMTWIRASAKARLHARRLDVGHELLLADLQRLLLSDRDVRSGPDSPCAPVAFPVVRHQQAPQIGMVRRTRCRTGPRLRARASWRSATAAPACGCAHRRRRGGP